MIRFAGIIEMYRFITIGSVNADETFTGIIKSRCVIIATSSFVLLNKEKRERPAEAADCRSKAKC